jgi:hypothetical protein
MKDISSKCIDVFVWISVGVMFYLTLVRVALDSPMLVRIVLLAIFVFVPITFIRRVLEDHGIATDVLWYFAPILLAGLMPSLRPDKS